MARTYAEADAISADTDKAIIIEENLADSDAIPYEIDRTDDMWSLADYVEKGIEVLDNDTGFFMMCEGGKIDWACHANDAGSSITTPRLWTTRCRWPSTSPPSTPTRP